MQLRLFLIFFLVLFQSSFPQTPPVISYPKVQSFTKNIMISPLFPSNTGGLVKDNLQVSTLAGNGLRGFNDGPGKDATFMSIHDITVDSNGNVAILKTDILQRFLKVYGLEDYLIKINSSIFNSHVKLFPF